MFPLLVDKNFNLGWYERTTIPTNLELTNGTLRCVGTQAEQALKDYFLPILEGQIIEVEVMARKVSGQPRISIDLYDQSGLSSVLDYINVTSTEWAWYKLRVVIPYGIGTKQFVRIAFGKWSGLDATDAYFQSPVISIDKGFGVENVIASGIVRVTNGTPSILGTTGDAKYRNFGISSVSYSGSTLKVYLEKSVNYRMKPLVFVSGTNESVEIPLAGKITPGATPYFEIQWSNGTQFVDVSAKTVNVFIKVTM